MDSVPETCGPGIWTRERLLSWHGSTELRRVPLWTVALEVGHQTANGARFALESRAFRSCQPPRRLRLLRFPTPSLREPNRDKTGIPTRDRDPHCGDGTGIKPGSIAVWLAHSRAHGQPTVTLYRIIIPILTVTWCLRYSHDGRFGRLLLLRWLLLLLLLHVPMFVPHATATPHYSWFRKSTCRCSSVACTGWSSPSPAPLPSLSPTPSPPQ